MLTTLALVMALSPAFANAQSNSKHGITQDIASFFKVSTAVAGSLVADVFSDLGTPKAVIKGEEGSGAFGIGYMKGAGHLMFDGVRSPIYWSGASVGFDVGGDGSKVYMLVYKLKHRSQAYRTMAGVEGKLYYVVGAGMQLGAMQYLDESSGLIVVPIRMGWGWRQGVNVGTLKLSPVEDWFPL